MFMLRPGTNVPRFSFSAASVMTELFACGTSPIKGESSNSNGGGGGGVGSF